MANKIILKLAGLYSAYNSLGSVPEGALVTANNIVIDKDDIGEIRRGFNLFGEAMGVSAANNAKQLIPYRNRIIRHYEPSTGRGTIEYQDTPGSTGFTEFMGLKNIFASSVSITGTTATFNTEKAHNLSVGDQFIVEGASPDGYNGAFTVGEILSTTGFNYTVGSALAPASGDILLAESTFKDAFQTDDINKLRYVEANSNLYFTTEGGVKKIDSFDATIIDAGISRALDSSLELFDEPDGFFEQETQVGYRIVWGITDANDNLILGAASSRAFISNPGLTLLIDDVNDMIASLTGEAALAGGTKTTITGEILSSTAELDDVRFALNDITAALTGDVGFTGAGVAAITGFMPITGGTLLTVQDTYDEIITAFASTSLTGDYEFATTSQNVTVTFAVPEGITPAHFYQIYRSSQSVDLDTAPNDDYQLVYEGNPTLAQLNAGVVEVLDEQPEEFKGAFLYQNPEQEGDGQANEKPPFATDVALFNGMTFYSNTRTVHKLSFTLVGLDPLNAGTSTLTITDGSSPFSITLNTTENVTTGVAKIYTDGTPAQNIANTANSIVRVINRYAANDLVNAYYISGPNDAPGSMLLEARTLDEGGFTLTAANSTSVNGIGTTISAYNPQLITAEESSNEEKTNRVYYSKLNEPEAVPALNFFNVGGGDNVIHRIAALRDSLFVFTDEGIYRVAGDTPQNLILSAFDDTTIIKSANSLAKGNTQIYFFSDQGIVSVSDTGTQVISRQIEDQLLPLLDSDYEFFQEATFGLFYQTDRKYILFTVEDTVDELATVAYVFNTFTNTWVKWTIGKSCGLVNPYDDKLYLGATDTNKIEQERKNFDYTDHADREHEVSILAVSRRITAISTSALISAKFHGLIDGDRVRIEDSNCTPSIDGEWDVTIIDDDTFSIDETITVSGNTGKWTSLDREVPVTLLLGSLDNVDVGDTLKQDRSSTVGSTSYDYTVEVPIAEIDESNNTVILGVVSDWIVGDATCYDYIPVELEWVPIHAGDPSILKHFREVHLMFDRFYSSDVKIQCYSDIQPNRELVEFDYQDFGNWGKFAWGDTPWGGRAVAHNVRTYIPLGKQRCRLLNVIFKHEGAREKWRLEGAAVFFRVLKIGERTNRT